MFFPIWIKLQEIDIKRLHIISQNNIGKLAGKVRISEKIT